MSEERKTADEDAVGEDDSRRQLWMRAGIAVGLIGLLLASGSRASSTSITTSVCSIVSAAFFRADVMCPGNHWIGM